MPRILASLLVGTLIAIYGLSHAAEYEVPPDHTNVETIARDIAYRGGTTAGGLGMSADPELREELDRRGLRYREGIDDSGNTGLQAMVLEDEKTGQTYIAFRGTWPKGREGAADVVADADAAGDTGSVQYNAHRERLAHWAQDYPGSIVTGHSLGAALGQRYISEHPDAVREGVLFNAPAIAPEHGHRFARAEKQPPVTIYVGKTKVPDGVSAPDYDFVSELGGRNHLPARIVEVTHAEPDTGIPFVNVLAASHTATMLSGDAERTIEEIPYEDYQRRREDSWRDAEPLLSKVRSTLLHADATIGAIRVPSQIGNAVLNVVQGYGKDGPAPPTPAMVGSGARDCIAAGGYVNRARRAIEGRITTLKISNAETNLLFARDRAVGCLDVRARIAGVEAAIGAASQALRIRQDQTDALRGRIRSATRACDIDALPALRSEAAKAASGALDREIALLQTARKGVSQFAKGKAAFDAGNYASARAPLQGALSAFDALPSGTCLTYIDRAQNGLEQVGKVLAQQAIVDGAIRECDVSALNTILTKYDGRNFRFFTESSARIRAALPACEEKSRAKQRPAREDAIADCHAQAADKGKVYGTIRFGPEGGYTCHFCEKGQVSNGVACIPDPVLAQPRDQPQPPSSGRCTLTQIRCHPRKNRNIDPHLDSDYQQCLAAQRQAVQQFQECRRAQRSAQPAAQPQPRAAPRAAPPAPCNPIDPKYADCRHRQGLSVPRGNYPR